MTRKGPDSEFILISEAVERLRRGMYGNFNRSEAVKEAKKHYPTASIGFGPQKEDAAKRIDNAIQKGELPVLVLSDAEDGAPLRVPRNLLRRMIRTRGGLPDHVIRPEGFLSNNAVTPELLATLLRSALYLRREGFDAWYQKARDKRNWPSQRSTSMPNMAKPRMGRPSKQNDLRNSIIALANQRGWSTLQTITDLVRLLKSGGKIVTRDTARRTVDQLFKETGEPCYRRRARRRSTGKAQ